MYKALSKNIFIQVTLRETLLKPDNVMFLLTTFVIGVVNAVVIGYMFKLMEDFMHANRTVMGLATLVASLAEILVFPFSERILRMCGGGFGGMISTLYYNQIYLTHKYPRKPLSVHFLTIYRCTKYYPSVWITVTENL